MKKIKIPEGWHEVPISQFIELSSITLTGIKKSIEVISILTDTDQEDIKKMSTEDFNKILKMLEWTAVLPETPFKTVITIDDQEYGLIDRLEKLTLGEWVDIENYLEEPMLNLHNIFAVLYRPLISVLTTKDRLIEPYDADTANVRAKLFFDKMSIGDVYGTLLFFSIIVGNYIKISREYLETEKS